MMPVKVEAVAGSRGRSSRRRRPLETTETEHVFPRQRRECAMSNSCSSLLQSLVVTCCKVPSSMCMYIYIYMYMYVYISYVCMYVSSFVCLHSMWKPKAASLLVRLHMSKLGALIPKRNPKSYPKPLNPKPLTPKP